MGNDEQKIFLIINLSFFGDVLVTNALCQNIKLQYPDSKIVFLVNKPFYEAAKYQCGADDVLVFDKRGKDKGILGLLKYALNCPYRNKIYASFIAYNNDRGILLSYLLNCKKRIADVECNLGFLVTDVVRSKRYKHIQDRLASMITALTNKEPQILPIKYCVNNENSALTNNIKNLYRGKDIVGLCTVGKHLKNYMPAETAIDVIQNLTQEGKIVFLFGAGKECREYANELKKRGCLNFVDLVDVTTIHELASIIKLCKGVITIDTGTSHLSYAVGIPTVCIYYQHVMVKKWAPRKELYPHTFVIDEDFSAENICNALKTITE